ncbi:MAG: helix-turn-helix domain-containing protein [Oscillospiraceae bacterium]|nr:helix-turn-helix domain-containing protein [Oscillospiraceae bacterium]
MYKIGELSRLCSLPVKILRYYDSEGLLVPDEIDRFTGYRYYSAARLADCNRIIALKELGFTLDEIRRHMHSDKPDDIAELVEAKIAELNETVLHTQSQLKRLEAVKEIITEGAKAMFDVIIRSADTMLTTASRKNYESKADAFGEIEKIKSVLPKNILGKREVIINYETEYHDRDFDLTACVEITGKLPPECGFNEKTITIPGDVASLVCDREELDEAYRYMAKQLEEAPCQIVGAFYEIYYDDGTVELKVPVCKLTKNSLFVSDDINLPFVNDPDAVGKWEMLDIVPSREQFVYGDEKCGHQAWLNELYFLDGGEQYWGVGGWTKGYLYTWGASPQDTLKNRYTIENQNSHTLMFLEMKHFKDGNGICGGMPEIWVYEKVSDEIFHASDIKLRDPVDYPFISDKNILGTWIVRDFYVWKIEENFDPAKQNWPKEDLFFLKVEFRSDGKCIHTTKQHVSTLAWTKGLMLNKHNETASKYEIKIIDGKEFLILEWKCGDYQFGGGSIYWYVFVRE